MDQYITGTTIKKLREEHNLTQTALAEKLNVSDKTISKWETGRGYPDIVQLEPLSKALGISVIELMSGNLVTNSNKCANMSRVKFYVCPICGNIIVSSGEGVINCCGINLPALEPENADEKHQVNIEKVEDEYFVSLNHEMSKTHYISFIAAVKDNGYELTKLYPEGSAEAFFKIRRTKYLYYYCNQHGLFIMKL